MKALNRRTNIELIGPNTLQSLIQAAFEAKSNQIQFRLGVELN